MRVLLLDGAHSLRLALRVLDPEPRRRRRSVLAKAAAPRERADVALARQPAVAPRGGGAVPLPQPHLEQRPVEVVPAPRNHLRGGRVRLHPRVHILQGELARCLTERRAEGRHGRAHRIIRHLGPPPPPAILHEARLRFGHRVVAAADGNDADTLWAAAAVAATAAVAARAPAVATVATTAAAAAVVARQARRTHRCGGQRRRARHLAPRRKEAEQRGREIASRHRMRAARRAGSRHGPQAPPPPPKARGCG
mmetsp:Transcript_34929/g.111621  ORF Transcript_34929/g.111621 Transcript_34929/m.111621 type:complete len:252 (-) Transcript_34929:62-817(-)